MQYFQASRAHNLWVHHKVLAAAMSARDENNNRWFSTIIVKYVRKYKSNYAGWLFQSDDIMLFRPSFSKDGFYSGYDINGMYTKNSQKEVVDYD